MSKKGYQVDEEEQHRLSSMPGVTVYTLESALAEAISPVYDWFYKQKGCSECAAKATEKEVLEVLASVIAELGPGDQHLCKEHE
jgi:hypothetical protein